MNPTEREAYVYRDWHALGKRVPRLGLAGLTGLEKDLVDQAYEGGIRFFFWAMPTSASPESIAPVRGERDNCILATGASLDVLISPRRTVERCLKKLRLDYLDIFLLLWVRSERRMKVFDELTSLRDEGKVRHIGISSHDRPLAVAIADRFSLDVLMVRYNAAHRESEIEVFSQLQNPKPEIITFNATHWGRLLKPPPGWPKGKEVPTAVGCYQFVLSNPNVDACLMRPRNRDELDQNLSTLSRGPLSPIEQEKIREFGDAVRSQS